MSSIASVVFWVVVFPHEGNLVTVEQLNFTRKGHMWTNESTIPLVDQVRPASEILGAGMYASLMGTFDFPAMINYIGSTSVGKSIATVVDRADLWVLPSYHEPEVPLSTMEVAYQAIIHTAVDSIMVPLTVSEEPEEAYLPTWAVNYLHSRDCLDMVFPLDEAILEAMCGRENIYEDLHHRSYFLLELAGLKIKSSI